MGSPVPFSLLLPVYGGDDPRFLRTAFLSAVNQQTRPPNDVVLVQDGPVGSQLAAEIARLIGESPVPVKHLPLGVNLGLGPALDRGLAECAHGVIARMDADDICVPHRFATQMTLIEDGADIVGSGLMEFVDDIDHVVETRVPPIGETQIRAAARFRDPFNHPTIVYRRDAVLAAGGYQDMPLMEDYLLFARMLANGAKPVNIAEPLVYYRVSAGAYARRGGVALLRAELELQRRFRADGITSRGEYVRNIVVRGGYRLVPESIRRTAYRRIIARRGAESSGARPARPDDSAPA